jgi:NAD(P)-dependent dehydrogenase (short-subunit alcohol dehydrogenase family)
MKLQGKIAVITGGNSGIGFGIAQEFQKEGARGAIVGRNQATLDASAQQLGGDFIALKGDVTQTADLKRVFQTVADTFGKLDVLVVNAGGAAGKDDFGSVVSITEEVFEGAINLNFKSVFFTVQQALPYMNDGASIVLVASSAAHRAVPGLTVYAAAKAGVLSFARSFSLDLLDRNIRVNALSPGTIDTPALDRLGLPAEAIAQMKAGLVETTPIKRVGQPSEMGRAAVFLASDDSSFLVGTEILADGGFINL